MSKGKYNFQWWGGVTDAASFQEKADKIKSSSYYYISETVALLYYTNGKEIASVVLELYFDENDKQRKTYLHGHIFNHDALTFSDTVESTFEKNIEYTFENAKEKMLEFAKMICRKYGKSK